VRRGRVWRLAAPLAAAVLGLAGCGWLGIGPPNAVPASVSAKSSQSCTAKLPTPRRYLGLAVPGVGATVHGAANFANLVGQGPNLVAYYVTFGTPFDAAATCAIASRGALPLIQIQPYTTSVAKIGEGFYDNYLFQYAEAVKKFGDPVVISFGHEMNGNWYPWGPPKYNGAGPGKTSPASFVAAWREIHAAFQAVGAKNVIWLWDPNIVYTYSPSLSEYYPGNGYVDWVGVDGYFRLPGETFQSVFGETLQEIAELTSKPMIIAETGVANFRGASAEIDSIFSGVESYKNMLGFVYFNSAGTLDWRLQDDPTALAAFRVQLHSGW
jgi:mannan endo-1,4-beta-mannosidase